MLCTGVSYIKLPKRVPADLHITIQMTRMERDGLIKKIRPTPNSTLLKFELTKKGIKLYKQIVKSGTVAAIMSTLSEKERQQLISMLERIINTSEKYF